MRIESAIEHDHWLNITIDGRKFLVGEKYTILELGYAVYIMVGQSDETWLKENGDVIPADPSDNRNELRSGHGTLITADPVLVALALESWWSRNGVPQPQDVLLPIPTAYEAIDIVRNRKILNDFNEKMTGFVPGMEIMAKRGQKPNLPISKQNQLLGNEEMVKSYKTDLNLRYWEYQRSKYPNCKNYFEREFAQDGRPPVFHVHEAWRNIIFDPNANSHEIKELLNLIPEGEHHKWFRSMNSSQALALSMLGNLAIHHSFGCLSDLQDDDGQKLFGEDPITSDSFSMEYKINYLGEPRRTSLDGYFSGNYRIAIECKFTESEVGTCSRPRLKPMHSNYENEYCDGTYSIQKTRTKRCSLTEIGVLYWEYLPGLFKWGNDLDLNPCPLNKNYQLVRNILAVGVKEDGSVSTENGHVALIYDERNPAFMINGAGFVAFFAIRDSLKRQAMLRKCSWQKIARHIRQENILPWLSEQLTMKYGL